MNSIDLAIKTGLFVETLYDIQRGNVEPSYATVQKIALALEVPIEDFLPF